MVNIKLADLTDRQLHLHLIELITPITRTLKHLETQMADLTQSLADLTDAVDAIGVRFQGLVVPLQEALEAAQTALAAALNDALAAAAAAGDEIESQVTELNAIGTPVEPTPEA